MPTGPQLHLLVNHLPILAFVFLTPLVALTLFARNAAYRRLTLAGVTIAGLLALPAYWSGEPAEEGIEHLAGVEESTIETHEEAAKVALVLALTTSGIAAAAWLVTRRKERYSKTSTAIVAAASLATTVTMAWAGHKGGMIRHPEISGSTPPAPEAGDKAD